MWEKVAMSSVTEVEGWRKNEREATLSVGCLLCTNNVDSLFYALLCGGPALCGDSKGKRNSPEAGCLNSLHSCTKEESSEERASTFSPPDSSFLGFPSQQRGKRVDRASWRRAPSL